jgi:hypothetical protein
LLKDRWRTDKAPSAAAPGGPDARLPSRASNGLDQFFSSIQGLSNLRILDLAGASQANVTYITNLGHRLYSDDVLRTLDDAFGGEGDFLENQSDPERVSYFLSESLDFDEGQFDGALVWDTLQFLAPPLLTAAVERLHRILRPQAALLAFFNAEEKATVIPAFSYRIVDAKTLLLAPRGQRKPVQFFNNRSLEKLFQNFQSVKFFLTRDHLREILVKR